MKHTLFVSTGAAGLLALGVAVPALASSGSFPSSSSSSSSTGQLSSSQLQSIEDFLADHPNLAQALAGRAAGWATFLAANPSIKAELTKVAGDAGRPASSRPEEPGSRPTPAPRRRCRSIGSATSRPS